MGEDVETEANEKSLGLLLPHLLCLGQVLDPPVPTLHLSWGLRRRVERWTLCLPCHCPSAWSLLPFISAEGGASVVVFAVLLASRVNSGCHGNPSRGREGEGRSEGEFLPLSAGSLNGDLQRMQTEGPEKDSGLGVLHGPPHFPAQPGSKFALHPTSLLLSGRDVGLSSCHRGFWVSGKKSWGG